MTLKDRYEKVIKKVNDLNAKKIRLEGNRDALMNNLKEYGCSNLEEAEKLNENNLKKIKTLEEEIYSELDALEKILEV